MASYSVRISNCTVYGNINVPDEITGEQDVREYIKSHALDEYGRPTTESDIGFEEISCDTICDGTLYCCGEEIGAKEFEIY